MRMSNNNKELIQEITQAIKINWQHRISWLISSWSDDEINRFNSPDNFIDYLYVWYNFGNVSDEVMDLGIASVYQIGDMIDYVTVVLMPHINEPTFKVYLPKEVFICLFEAEKEKREI